MNVNPRWSTRIQTYPGIHRIESGSSERENQVMMLLNSLARMLVTAVAAAFLLNACDSEVAPPTNPPKPAERTL